MAFVKAPGSSFAPQPTKPPHVDRDPRADLESPDAVTRRHAARELAGNPDAAEVLAARLNVEADRTVQAALFGSLVDIGGALVATLVASLLRSSDAGLRNHALDALKHLGEAAEPAVDDLLADADPDLRLLAIEVTRDWSSVRAGPRLRRIIEADPHVNVCGAAVDVATELGTDDLMEPLEGLRERFAEDEFLRFAVDVACTRLAHPDRAFT